MKRSNRSCALRLLGSGVVLGLFLVLARAVSSGATSQWDATVRARIHALAGPSLTWWMLALTQLGEVQFLVPFCAVVSFLLLREGRRHAAMVFLVSAGGGEAFDQFLKFWFHRVRPAAFFGLTSPANYSFPSGHALLSVAVFGMLAAVLSAGVRNRLARAGIWAAAATLIGLIGMSRIYLGMHWPTDVLGGFTAGVGWLLAVSAFS